MGNQGSQTGNTSRAYSVFLCEPKRPINTSIIENNIWDHTGAFSSIDFHCYLWSEIVSSLKKNETQRTQY